MKKFIPAPENPEEFENWRNQLEQWRSSYISLNDYKSDYADWVDGEFVEGMVMLWDEELWNEKEGYTVDRFLDRVEETFGKWDHVVLWNNYPLSGLDDRNQIDYFEDLPGGKESLKKAVANFQRRGVRVMLDHKPWVPGAPEGYADADRALLELIKYCGIDGLFLDCAAFPRGNLRPHEKDMDLDITYCSEANTPFEHMHYQPFSWNQFKDDSKAPGIMTNKWLDRRAKVYETRRYYYHPMAELQRAWMNGNGHVIWENVFGYWAEYSPRYCSWLKLCTAAQRFFVKHFTSEDWKPLCNGNVDKNIYASAFSHEDKTLYTITNRSGSGVFWKIIIHR